MEELEALLTVTGTIRRRCGCSTLSTASVLSRLSFLFSSRASSKAQADEADSTNGSSSSSNNGGSGSSSGGSAGGGSGRRFLAVGDGGSSTGRSGGDVGGDGSGSGRGSFASSHNAPSSDVAARQPHDYTTQPHQQGGQQTSSHRHGSGGLWRGRSASRGSNHGGSGDGSTGSSGSSSAVFADVLASTRYPTGEQRGSMRYCC